MFKCFVQSQIFIQSLNFEILKIRQKNTSDFVCYNNSVQLKINKTTQPLCQLKHSFRTHYPATRWHQIEKKIRILIQLTTSKRVFWENLHCSTIQFRHFYAYEWGNKTPKKIKFDQIGSFEAKNFTLKNEVKVRKHEVGNFQS